MLLWKLNVGFEGVEAVVLVAAGPEVAGVDEPKFPNMFPVPAGFVPNMPPEVAEAPPNRLLAGLEVLSVGGGPAGVVEVPKFRNGLLGAGVVDPAGAVVEAFVDEFPPKIFCPAAGLLKPPNMLGVVAPPVLFSLLAPGVDAPPSSFFCPKVKVPPPKEGVDCPAPPNSELDPLAVPAGLPKAPPAGAVPVLLPKSDGVDVPEPGLDPVVPPPNSDGTGGLPVLEVLLRLLKIPLDGGCEVAAG